MVKSFVKMGWLNQVLNGVGKSDVKNAVATSDVKNAIQIGC